MSKEAINHPAHYGGENNPYEAIKVIEAWGLGYGFLKGNVLKYLSRSKHKGNEIEDIRKAKWYLDRLLLYLEREKNEGPDG